MPKYKQSLATLRLAHLQIDYRFRRGWGSRIGNRSV